MDANAIVFRVTEYWRSPTQVNEESLVFLTNLVGEQYPGTRKGARVISYFFQAQPGVVSLKLHTKTLVIDMRQR